MKEKIQDNSEILVSIIIPTYGIPDYLQQAIESVQNQTVKNWELIIVDDNNPGTEAREETEKCVTAFLNDKRIRYIQHEKNKNGAAARNTGLAIAKGRYIAFLDSDDFYLTNRLEKCVQVMEETDDMQFGGVYTGCEFRRNGKKYHVEEQITSGNFMTETLACTFKFCTGSNIFMRSEIVKDLMFDESFTRHQDYEFLVRYFEKYSLIALPEVLVVKNNDNKNVPHVEGIITIKKKYVEKYQRIIESLDKDKSSQIYFCHAISIAESAIRDKKLKVAREYYLKAKGYSKISIYQKFRLIALMLNTLL